MQYYRSPNKYIGLYANKYLPYFENNLNLNLATQHLILSENIFASRKIAFKYPDIRTNLKKLLDNLKSRWKQSCRMTKRFFHENNQWLISTRNIA